MTPLTWLRLAWIPIAVAALISYPLVSDDIYYQNMLIMTFMLAIGASGWNIMAGTRAICRWATALHRFGGLHHRHPRRERGHLAISRLPGRRLDVRGRRALLSLITRRTRGMYFVIVTFATLQLLGVVATISSGLTGGSQGLAMPLRPGVCPIRTGRSTTHCSACSS